MAQGTIPSSPTNQFWQLRRLSYISLAGLLLSILLSPQTYAQAFPEHAAVTVSTSKLLTMNTPLTMKELSLLAGAFVALMTFLSGQVIIPLYKYRMEQRKGKELIITIMKVMADKTLDFFGDNTSTSIFDKVSYQIQEQIERTEKDNHYIAHVSVSNEDILRTKLLDKDHFWLVEEEILKAFIKFEENASRARFMCRSVMDKEYLELVKDDRKRYVAALEQVKKQFDDWLISTRELKEALKEY